MSGERWADFPASHEGFGWADCGVVKHQPVIFRSLRSLAILLALPFLLFACCPHAQPRFWKVRDGKTTAYTVDTVAVPSTSLQPRDIRYVDSSGKYVDVAKPKMVSQMSEEEWKQATSGAGYSLWFCGHRMACWARTKAR